MVKVDHPIYLSKWSLACAIWLYLLARASPTTFVRMSTQVLRMLELLDFKFDFGEGYKMILYGL